MVNFQIALLISCFIVLIYLAVLFTISFNNESSTNPLEQSLMLDSQQYDEISTGSNYLYQTNTGKSVQNTILNGLNFSQNQFLLLYDSTPFASKGHAAMTLPCNADDPSRPIFQLLSGRAPDLFPVPLGFIQNISSIPSMCVFHGQFGFGDPISDLALQYLGEESIELNGPYSIVISDLESYIPKQKSFLELQMAQMNP